MNKEYLSKESGLSRFFYPILLFALILRLFVALKGDFMMHPDELMQYLEQGHRIVFGYGTIPWEFRAGARSWLMPGIIAGILYPLKALGLDSPAIYINIVKIFFSLLSLTIPVSAYIYCRREYSEKTALIALFLSSFWYELIVFAHKPMLTMMATYLIMTVLALNIEHMGRRRVVLIGILLTMAVAFRLQVAPLVLYIIISIAKPLNKEMRRDFFLTIIFVFFLVGLFDYLTWGTPWYSYYQSVYLNIFSGVSSHFGYHPFYHYFLIIFLATAGLFYFAIFFPFIKGSWHRYRFLLTSIAIVLFVHTMIGHKEYRFIFIIIPFWLIMAADILSELSEGRGVFIAGGILLSLVSLAGLFNKLPKEHIVYKSLGYEIHNFWEKRLDLQAYLYLNRLEEVTGVFDSTAHWSLTGGYYYLHRKVPLYDQSMRRYFFSGEPIGSLVSHILTESNILKIPGFVRKIDLGGIIVWERVPLNQPQRMWDNYNINKS